jgi:hypothetical protein
MNKKELRKKIKELPVNLGIVGLALVFGLAERGAAAVSEILEGPGRGMSRSLKRIEKTKNFWDYYDELKNLKENSARTILWRLQKKGLVKKEESRYRLTSQGFNIIKIFQKKEQPEELWDGKWRMIMFDIPEKRRDKRDWLRWQLTLLDYKPLQKSVFIGKQPIRKDLYEEFLEQKLNQYIRLITVGEIDDDEIFNI